MDQPGLHQQEHHRALKGLARLNSLSLTANALWARLRQAAAGLNRPLRVLDLASGGGDITIRLWQKASQAGTPLQILGVDISPVAVQYARAAALQASTQARSHQARSHQARSHQARSHQAKAIQPKANKQAGELRFSESFTENSGGDCESSLAFEQLDVLADPLPGRFDVTLCSLFLHHLEESAAVELLAKMATATDRLLLVSDLQRSRLGYMLVQAACHVFSRSRVVHVDGPRSVAAAFTEGELADLFCRANLEAVQISQHWPCRMLAQWHPPAESA